MKSLGTIRERSSFPDFVASARCKGIFLKRQRLEPYRRFAKLVEKHWDGIISTCHPGNKVSLGRVQEVSITRSVSCDGEHAATGMKII